MQAIHDNRINQKSYTVTNPGFTTPTLPNRLRPSRSPHSSITYHSVDPHFHAALDMQGGIGVDRQIAKHITATSPISTHRACTNTCPTTSPRPPSTSPTTPSPVPRPRLYNYQFQSGGFYRQNQLIVSSSMQLKHFTSQRQLRAERSQERHAGHQLISLGCAGSRLRLRPRRLRHTQSFHVDRQLYRAAWLRPRRVLCRAIGHALQPHHWQRPTGNNQFNARPAYGTCGAPASSPRNTAASTPTPSAKTSPSSLWHRAGTRQRRRSRPLQQGLRHWAQNRKGGRGPNLHARRRKRQQPRPRQRRSGHSSRCRRSTPLQSHPRRRRQQSVNMVNLGTPNGVLLSPLFNQRNRSPADSSATARPAPHHRIPVDVYVLKD